jgi:hypothetical protein
VLSSSLRPQASSHKNYQVRDISLFVFPDLKVFFAVVASSPSVGNCRPFGGGATGWGSYLFYEYSNLPPFALVSGDILGFDLGNINDYTPAFASISFATLTEDSTGAYTAIVGDSAASSRGDSVTGNFETRFVISAPYSFPGGTLVIRFQNGGTAAASTGFSTDTTCDPVQVYGMSTDASG